MTARDMLKNLSQVLICRARWTAWLAPESI
jgi:hypothetical protein